MTHRIFDNGTHAVHVYNDLVDGTGHQTNQVLITNGEYSALIDPGGELTYTPLSVMISRHIQLDSIAYIFATHQDPDVIASLPKWMSHTQANVVVSKLWVGFLPHLASSFSQNNVGNMLKRIQPIPDSGKVIALGSAQIMALPAHFMHSSGNFSFYDTISKTLFSGDIGSSFGTDAKQNIEDFLLHTEHMKAFHQRYIASNKACRFWVANVRKLDIDCIVPQHGCKIQGKEQINQFLNWLEQLPCGLDLMDASSYELNR